MVCEAVCDLASSILTNPFRIAIGDVNAAAPDAHVLASTPRQQAGRVEG